jgi:hypothetical protein
MYLERMFLRKIFALSVYNILLFMKPFSDTGERNLRAMSKKNISYYFEKLQ